MHLHVDSSVAAGTDNQGRLSPRPRLTPSRSIPTPTDAAGDGATLPDDDGTGLDGRLEVVDGLGRGDRDALDGAVLAEAAGATGIGVDAPTSTILGDAWPPVPIAGALADPAEPADGPGVAGALAVEAAVGPGPEACGASASPADARYTISPSVAAVNTASTAGSDRPCGATCGSP